MTMVRHENIFSGVSYAEAYEALQRGYNKNTRVQLAWEMSIIACGIGAIVFTHQLQWIWLFLGLFMTVGAIGRYVDNSNRTWVMLLMDYHEHAKERN